MTISLVTQLPSSWGWGQVAFGSTSPPSPRGQTNTCKDTTFPCTLYLVGKKCCKVRTVPAPWRINVPHHTQWWSHQTRMMRRRTVVLPRAWFCEGDYLSVASGINLLISDYNTFYWPDSYTKSIMITREDYQTAKCTTVCSENERKNRCSFLKLP